MTLKEEIIYEEVRKYFGDRYYNEYSSNPVTGVEFDKIVSLINTCIEKQRIIELASK